MTSQKYPLKGEIVSLAEYCDVIYELAPMYLLQTMTFKLCKRILSQKVFFPKRFKNRERKNEVKNLLQKSLLPHPYVSIHFLEQ